jgi:uncharacterized protein YdiU (UPF0061 family)
VFQAAITDGYAAKLGIDNKTADDTPLIQDFLTVMANGAADYALSFRTLSDAAEDPAHDQKLRALFADATVLEDWLQRWRQRLAQDPRAPHEIAAGMRAVNPVIIPRNHQVEAAIKAAVGSGDFAPFHRLVDELAKPFDDRPGIDDLKKPPNPGEIVRATFCGT